MSDQKMREALELMARGAVMANIGSHTEMSTVEAYQKLAREALAAPAGEQVGLTDAEIDKAAVASRLICSTGQTYHVEHADIRPFIRSTVRRVIAAHEAKRASCSQIAKKSTCEGGRVDGIEKCEHVGGAA